ncbi:MAG: hypothetical protein ACKVP3_22755 [Hyphomicrobiaceae bacterium]
MRTKISKVAIAAGLPLGLMFAAGETRADPLGELPGRWSGSGSIRLTNGTTETVKCVATYFVTGGANVTQNLRCASPGYKIDTKARLAIRGGQVTGNWEERQYAQTGAVTGRMTSNGFNLQISGTQFTAALQLTSTACKQSISISPKGFDISRISIGLGKC